MVTPKAPAGTLIDRTGPLQLPLPIVCYCRPPPGTAVHHPPPPPPHLLSPTAPGVLQRLLDGLDPDALHLLRLGEQLVDGLAVLVHQVPRVGPARVRPRRLVVQVEVADPQRVLVAVLLTLGEAAG